MRKRSRSVVFWTITATNGNISSRQFCLQDSTFVLRSSRFHFQPTNVVRIMLGDINLFQSVTESDGYLTVLLVEANSRNLLVREALVDLLSEYSSGNFRSTVAFSASYSGQCYLRMGLLPMCPLVFRAVCQRTVICISYIAPPPGEISPIPFEFSNREPLALSKEGHTPCIFFPRTPVLVRRGVIIG